MESHFELEQDRKDLAVKGLVLSRHPKDHTACPNYKAHQPSCNEFRISLSCRTGGGMGNLVVKLRNCVGGRFELIL